MRLSNMKKNEISIVIHTRNEEANIEDCIATANFLAKKICVIDMESTDNTITKVRETGATVFSFPFSHFVEPAREFGIEKAGGEWVFIMDADEKMTKELAEEIKHVITSNEYTSYKVPRKNIFAHTKWLQHGGWYPDYVIRLIKKDSFVSWPKEIHSTPVIKGQQGRLQELMIHYFHPSLENMVNKTVTYENIESNLLFEAKKPVSTPIFFRKFLGELNRRLILKRGFLDSTPGLIESLYQAYSKTITYIFLYEKYQKSRSL